MNPALLRFVADYLAEHAARSAPGSGARGRVQIDPQLDQSLELRFEDRGCHVQLAASNAVDCHLKIPWLRLVQLLDEELSPRDALSLNMVKIDGDHALGERALEWLHGSNFGWHVYNKVPVWQLQANLGEKSVDEIRAFANDVYQLPLAAAIGKTAAINTLVEHFRGGPRLRDALRGESPPPIHKSCIRFDAEQMRADF